MNFDFMVSNPAFNIAESNNKAGTGGNTTLYRTATRHAFKLLKPNGLLLNITLKGIIPDLIEKYFSKYQTYLINLMDDIEVWPYNTCYFIVGNTLKNSPPILQGGLSAKIFSPNLSECFPFVYYSGANNGMTGFSSNGKYRVIRKLPGRHHSFIYDQTDIETDTQWKFAFNVMESKLSYTVTNEPIRGGTICYIPTKTKQEAENLKLFVENNTVYSRYVKYSKIKYHAFGLRNIKKFNLCQINTGHEVPLEWNITPSDLIPPIKLNNEFTEDKNKIKQYGQVYTPVELVRKTLNDLELFRPDTFVNPNYSFCDTMCGNGSFLKTVLNNKMLNGIDKKTALQSIYGVDIDPVSINDCKNNLLNGDEHLRYIVDKNIQCQDTFLYDFSFV